MNPHTIRQFFKWCTLINGGLLILSSLFIRFAGAWIFEMHGHWIPMARDAFNGEIYLLLGFFKIIVIAFNLVPYLALVIIGRAQAKPSGYTPS